MNSVIKVENLSKQYRLGNVGTGSIAHDLNRAWHRILKKEDPYLKIGESNDRTRKGNSSYIWALKDINFEVQQGEVLGIIGRNGAGKSTLLKILSRTTTPTTGSVKIKGKVASLLEVGTGFHPELTGRENIYLNGAILGMTKKEISRKFDEIVDFAGVERYIDTPVKRYSSGMYVRLAFGVAAHLEPEILIVDEVLAVGDAEFQKKALGKMKDVSKNEGRTVLFVSHNMGTVLQLCKRSLLLNGGEIEYEGKTDQVVEKYYSNNAIHNRFKHNSTSDIYFKNINTFDKAGTCKSSFAQTEDVYLRIEIGINQFDNIQNIGLALLTKDKNRVFTINKSLNDFSRTESDLIVEFILPGKLIAPMDYSFLVALNTKTGLIYYDLKEDICPIKIYDDGTDFAFAEGYNYGCIIIKDKWRQRFNND